MSTVTTSRLGYDKQHCSSVAPFFLKGLSEADFHVEAKTVHFELKNGHVSASS